MKEFYCILCGYCHRGDEPPERCPICGSGASKFSEDGDLNRSEDERK